MRWAWLINYCTNWCGDDGWLFRVRGEFRKFNYMGDTQFLTGTVSGKREEDGRHLVDLELHMVNQRDTETAYGSATVALPSSTAGLPTFPHVPRDLEVKAAQMFARHNELAAQRQRLR